MSDLSGYWAYDIIDLWLLGGIITTSAVVLFFYIYYYRIVVAQCRCSDEKSEQRRLPSVSVVIVANNSATHLAQTLPAILEQDYPDFEVIVVNDGSTDDTEMLVKSLQRSHSNLYGTYLPQSQDKRWGRKRMAMTIGIKAAKKEIVLFTEPFCVPLSNRWILRMASAFDSQIQFVAGHSVFCNEEKTLSSRKIAFDNLQFSMRYLSAILREKPFAATYRNLAMKRTAFFEAKGFASVLNHEYGEELLLNKLMAKGNTNIALGAEAYVQSILDNDEDFIWKGYKTAFQKVQTHFRESIPFSLEAISRSLLVVLWLALLGKSLWHQQFAALALATALATGTFVFEVASLNRVSKALHAGKYYLLYPYFVLMQPIRNYRYKLRKVKNRNIGDI